MPPFPLPGRGPDHCEQPLQVRHSVCCIPVKQPHPGPACFIASSAGWCQHMLLSPEMLGCARTAADCCRLRIHASRGSGRQSAHAQQQELCAILESQYCLSAARLMTPWYSQLSRHCGTPWVRYSILCGVRHHCPMSCLCCCLWCVSYLCSSMGHHVQHCCSTGAAIQVQAPKEMSRCSMINGAMLRHSPCYLQVKRGIWAQGGASVTAGPATSMRCWGG